jgi:shikimate dehydrogenase
MPVLRAGLIGSHISRTRLPAALQIMCDAAGWRLDFDLIDTHDAPGFDFDATVQGLRDRGWTGVTVTHPHKSQARRFAGAGMTPDVAHLGASNTLVFGEKLAGYNTDYTGFIAAYEMASLPPSGDVVMMGAGGVAQALGPALDRLCHDGARIGIHDPRQEQAETLVATIGPRARILEAQDVPQAVREADGLVNATPLGMAEYPGSAFDAKLFTKSQSWAFDAVYTPTNTDFLKQAREAGLRCLTGFDLFRAMAVGSFNAYTGLDMPVHDVAPTLDILKPD